VCQSEMKREPKQRLFANRFQVRYHSHSMQFCLIRRTMRFSLVIIVILGVNPPAQGQFFNRANTEHLNGRLAGHVVDYTSNHHADRRIFSPILGMPRDLYVYVPPGYNPACAYPLILFLHMASVDEHYFIGSKLLEVVDELIIRGEFPPAVLACPDGTYSGWNRLNAKHSFYVNGSGGRFEDHILQEVIPFLITHYSIRPEREAHAMMGLSAGGYGAMGLAIKHRNYIGAVATLAAPLNLRYSNSDERYFNDFDPATYRWKIRYDPQEIIGVFYSGLLRIRARKFMIPVFGDGNAAVNRIVATNPADLVFSTDLKSDELSIYVNYPGRDNFNFDAQAESFCWLAARNRIEVTLVCDPKGTHSPAYFRNNIRPAFSWLGRHLLAPTAGLPPANTADPVLEDR
jgi:S-formylglutathione hydrolase FrmB